MQVKDGKLQSSNGNVSEDRIDNVDNTAHLKDVDVLHEDSLTSKVHFPIDITTTQEVSSMNQNNCISAESLQRFQQWKPGLEPKECWINDEGINAYNSLLTRKFLKMDKAIDIFSSYFFQRLKRFERSAPEKILDSVCQINLLSKEAWVIPSNDGAHWKVIIVNLIDKSLCLYDPIDHEESDTEDLHVTHFQTVRNLIKKVHRWFGKEGTSGDWKQCIAEDTPKQCNSFDCGIFLLKFVDFVVSGKPFSFSQDVEENLETAVKECEENKFYVKELGHQLNKLKAEKEKALKSLKTLKRLKNKLKEMSSSQEDLSTMSVKELRKTLSVIKIEKEDIETALNDSRRESQLLEEKNKVQTVEEFQKLFVENEVLKDSVTGLQQQYRSTAESNELTKQIQDLTAERKKPPKQLCRTL